jgi:hypothetical protein
MSDVILYAIVIPTALFGLETLALSIWVGLTSEPKPKRNKLTKKGK